MEKFQTRIVMHNFKSAAHFEAVFGVAKTKSGPTELTLYREIFDDALMSLSRVVRYNGLLGEYGSKDFYSAIRDALAHPLAEDNVGYYVMMDDLSNHVFSTGVFIFWKNERDEYERMIDDVEELFFKAEEFANEAFKVRIGSQKAKALEVFLNAAAVFLCDNGRPESE